MLSSILSTLRIVCFNKTWLHFFLLSALLTFTSVTHAMQTEVVSVLSNGFLSNGGSFNATVSADGRYVVFESSASDLVAGDNNANSDVFLRDTQNNTTTLISVNSAGTGSGNGASISPTISADGRFVAFDSNASDLVADDNNANTDVFLRDTQNNTTTLISVNSAGTGSGNFDSIFPAVSADGRFVAFESGASDLVAGDNNANFDVFLRDTQNNTTTLISVNSAGTGGGNGFSIFPAVSADGRYVAFVSGASDLVAGDNNGNNDIFLRDTQNNTTTLISVNSAGTGGGNNNSTIPTISADGRYVAFSSNASDLVSGDNNGENDIFLRDTQNNTTTLISVNSAGTGSGNSGSTSLTISADGRFVAFSSDASDLVADDNNANSDVFLRDTQNNNTTLISVNSAGTGGGNSGSTGPTISDDGRFVAFSSNASDLVAGDNNANSDVFLRNVFADSGPVAASTLPASRSVQVGQTATAFATIINASATEDAINCSIVPSTSIASDFSYQTTDAMNMLTGNPNMSVDLPASAIQNFVLSFTPTAAFAPTDVAFTYDCANTDMAASTVGLNTLLLSADVNPVSDVVGLTTVVDLIAPQGNTTLFAVGSSNVGATGDITASVDAGGLPLNASLCQTNAMGACLNTPAASETFNYAASSSASFAIFVEPTAAISNDPANNRIFIRFTDGNGVVRGATSTAVRTQ